MEQFVFPEPEKWSMLIQRPGLDFKNLAASVLSILQAVKNRGDLALIEYTRQFDGVELNDFTVSTAEFQAADSLVTDELKGAIEQAKKNIEVYHQHQFESSSIEEKRITTSLGVECWRRNLPIEKVGLYIPGGTAPLFSSVLMLGIPAKIVGCSEIVLCTPPDRFGKIHPAILYTAKLLGFTAVFKVGGAQAIAAMAFGTENIPKVFKIFGPGNQYVTAAKQILVAQEGIAIDLPAGPTELLVIADKTATPSFVASDLLSQAEHGIDSQVFLLSDQQSILDEILHETKRQLALLPRREIAEKALENSKSILFRTLTDAISFSNFYAPEHLILAVDKPENLASLVTSAGSVFLGHYAPEAVGDYASGTNHTLPTCGHAVAYSGVSVDSFVKKVTFQQLTKEGIKKIGPVVEIMAEAEELAGHRNAITVRLDSLEG